MRAILKAPLYKITLLATLAMASSCKNLEAREAISTRTSTTTDFSIERNKELYAAQEAQIEEIIAADSLDYQRSASGFYYTFIKQDSIITDRAKYGDRVTIEYNISSIDNQPIYTTSELSPLTKSLEQEYGIFKGLREGLKLMQENDEAIFYFPSYAAYGFYGDQDRIGINTPIRSRVKLLKIE
ncbi:gliding motility-associated peptidyl-prolyl isomerase GldI [Nonlabens ponticola]|uniref:Peptidyl-prolyl cis-trans isomerase n=1 Tax=Nonlabens ponticola TaxID=2496866 RepID=A0A3S9MZ32_9FLAO|nr:gliding motility-associated peptidyl-prolyl isomerase GldI [Nonlabens ponticola]AZQ44394.1 gliding motility-associated peptidyl-prolyl isomerase GldI [Nonlabens ponticola]